MRAALAALCVLIATAPPARGSEATEVAAATPAARVLGWADGTAPQAPANFRVFAFARGLDGPHALLVLPNGDVLVAESRGANEQGRASANRLTLLRDSTGKGTADQQFVLLSDLDRPSGLALRRDRLLVAGADAVLSCPFLVGQIRMHGDCHTLAELPSAGGYDHWTRSLALDPDESRLYVAVGSSGEAAPDARDLGEPGRASILALAPEGHGMRVFASGLRDPGGLAVEPRRGRLYAAVSERAWAAGDGPPDYFTHVEEGAFFGWGSAAPRPGRAPKPAVPDLALGAGTVPRAVLFYTREHFPRGLRGGAFIVLAGGSERFAAPGYRVIHVPFADGRPSGPPQDFLTGFVRDPATGALNARPLALAVATDGTLLVADDSGSIWRVVFKCAACTPDPVQPRERRPSPGG
jgi:glucose/arabinose dehydrogenase